MVNHVTQTLSVCICKDAKEAIARGFNWGATPGTKPIEVKQVVVVQNGTVAGNPTVDFVLEDETGQRYVFVITGRLLQSIPCGDSL